MPLLVFKRPHMIFILLIILAFTNSAIVPRFSPTDMSTSINDQRQYLLGLVNKVRTGLKLNTLYLDPTLNQLAQDHSEDMLQNDFFDHTNLDGDGPQDRAQKIGFLSGVGENIAYNYDFNLTELHQNLMDSPPHYSNTINKDWNRVGFGIAHNDTHTFLTVVFSSRDFDKFPITSLQLTDLLTKLKSNIEKSNKFKSKTPFWPQLSQEINSYLKSERNNSIFSWLKPKKGFRYRSIEYKIKQSYWSSTLANDARNSFKGTNGYSRYGIGVFFNKAGEVQIWVVYITPL